MQAMGTNASMTASCQWNDTASTAIEVVGASATSVKPSATVVARPQVTANGRNSEAHNPAQPAAVAPLPSSLRSNVSVLDAPNVEGTSTIPLPASLRNNVVVLDAPNADGTSTKVYLMGVSHVSKVQAEQVKAFCPI
jgi:hypothetical protein